MTDDTHNYANHDAGLDVDPLAERASTVELRRVIEGRSQNVPKHAAIDEYARRRAAKAAELLSEVAGNSAEEPSVRIHAAMAIAATTQKNRSDLLVNLVRQREPLVRAGAVRGLAAAGDASALETLVRMETRPSDASLARDVAFAATMISHREGLDRHAFTMPAASRLIEPDPAIAFPIEVRRARKPEVEEAVERARRTLIGFEPSDGMHAQALNCMGRQILVVPDRNLEPQRFARLLQQPAIAAGVFTGAELSLGHYELTSYVLTKPGRRNGSLEFSVWSNRGRMWLAGTADTIQRNQTDDRLSFEARGVENKNTTPVLFRGRLVRVSGDWEVDVALSSPAISRERRPARRPTRAATTPT